MQTAEFRTRGAAAFGLLTQRVLSSESLGQMMDTFHLYDNDRAQGQKNEAMEKMRKSIKVASLLEQPALGFVSISYYNPDPTIAPASNPGFGEPLYRRKYQSAPR